MCSYATQLSNLKNNVKQTCYQKMSFDWNESEGPLGDKDFIDLGLQGGFEKPEAKDVPENVRGEGPGVSGHPGKTHPGKVLQKQDLAAGGGDKGNQSNPKSKTKSNPKQTRTIECKQGCPEALKQAALLGKVLARVDALEAELLTLKSKLKAHEEGPGHLPSEAKVKSDLAKIRAEEGLKAVSKLSEDLRQRWVTYYDADLRPVLSAKEALDYIRACGWPAELLVKAGTASLNDVACGIARLYHCQGLTAGIDERHHFISWNTVTRNECLDYITWATPCLGQWLESLSSDAKDELLSSYKAGDLDLNLAKQPSAMQHSARSILKPVKRKKSKALAQVPMHNDLEGKSSNPINDNAPVLEEQMQQESGASATKRAKTSREANGPSSTDRYKHNRRRVTQTWRNKMVSQGHWQSADVDKLCKSLKDLLQGQGLANLPAYDEEVRVNAIQVINLCTEVRDEAAYQAQVAKTAKTPAPAPSTSRLLPPNNNLVERFGGLDVRDKPGPSKSPNIRGRGSWRGAPYHSSRGGHQSRGHHHHSRGKGSYKPRGGRSSY